MLRKSCLLILFVISWGSANSVFASQSGTYGGLSYHTGKFSSPGSGVYSPPALSFKYGKYVYDNFAVEGRVLVGILRWKKVLGVNSEREIAVTNGFSILAKGNLPLNKDASLYGLVGYGQLGLKDKSTISGVTTSSTNTESGPMYGVGAEITIGNTGYGLYAEYMSYPGASGSLNYDYTGFNVGITKEF